MVERHPPLRITAGRVETVYHLRGDDEWCVQEGDDVSPHALLARSPRGPVVVALASELHLSADAGERTVARLTGTTVHINESLGTHRVGLVKRTLRAPIDGATLGAPRSGAIAIRSGERHVDLRARFGGIVSVSRPDQITVATAAHRLSAGIVASVASGHAPLVLPGVPVVRTHTEAAPANVPPGTIVSVIGHLGSLRDLAAARKSAHAIVIVGAVSEEVAWALLSPAPQSSEPPGARSGVVVLGGLGNPAVGAEAVSTLAPFAGLPVVIDGRAGAIAIVLNHAPKPDSVVPGASNGVYRDPSHWGIPCAVEAETFLWTFAWGLRTVACRVSSDLAVREITPTANIARGHPRAE